MVKGDAWVTAVLEGNVTQEIGATRLPQLCPQPLHNLFNLITCWMMCFTKRKRNQEKGPEIQETRIPTQKKDRVSVMTTNRHSKMIVV